ncbi:MAG: N-acetylmuramoyl-L-alanine amidase [Candidatus Hodarchaeales archaeon]|jgi:parallel beta-helix repeat protein
MSFESTKKKINVTVLTFLITFVLIGGLLLFSGVNRNHDWFFRSCIDNLDEAWSARGDDKGVSPVTGELASINQTGPPQVSGLNIVSRTDWGCPDGQSSPLWDFEMSYRNVTHVIIHHTENDNENDTSWSEHVKRIWIYHNTTKRWGDIAYNYLIDPDGIVYEGRAGGDNVTGGHAYNHNYGTMGVAFLGTFNEVEPTTAALNSATILIAWKCSQSDIDPLGMGLDLYEKDLERLYRNGTEYNYIAGHRDVGDTDCPGQVLYSLLPKIRMLVAQAIATDFPGDHYETSAPIAIDGNQEFIARAIAKGWPGSGTASNPFIIDGLRIIGDGTGSLIDIRNTNVHFRVSNCYLKGGVNGIFLDNVSHTNVVSNTVTNNVKRGIYNYNSNNNNFKNNVISSNGLYGLDVFDSYDDVNYHCHSLLIAGNNFVRNSYCGLELLDMPPFYYIDYKPNYYLESGISTSKIISTSESRSTFSSNPRFNVTWNNFIDNNPGGDSQAYDETAGGVQSHGTFMYNYWDNWTIASPYPIDVPSYAHYSNEDPHPLTGPHYISKPVVIYPTGGESLSGTVTIEWKPAHDSHDHQVTYALYYSPESDLSWHQLVSGLSSTSHEWNTTEISDSNTYWIKVIASCSGGIAAMDQSEHYFSIENQVFIAEFSNDSKVVIILAAISLIIGMVIIRRKM